MRTIAVIIFVMFAQLPYYMVVEGNVSSERQLMRDLIEKKLDEELAWEHDVINNIAENKYYQFDAKDNTSPRFW